MASHTGSLSLLLSSRAQAPATYSHDHPAADAGAGGVAEGGVIRQNDDGRAPVEREKRPRLAGIGEPRDRRGSGDDLIATRRQGHDTCGKTTHRPELEPSRPCGGPRSSPRLGFSLEPASPDQFGNIDPRASQSLPGCASSQIRWLRNTAISSLTVFSRATESLAHLGSVIRS
jgi:hypothetical protein